MPQPEPVWDSPADPRAATGETLIQSPFGWRAIDLAGLWRHRELLLSMAMRDIRVRYKQTALGALWAVIQPFVLMVVIAVFLGRITGVRDPVFLYAGLLPWTFFAASVTGSTNSLIANAPMLRKIYFPRLVLPLAAVGAPLLDYAVAFIVLIALMAWYGVAPGVEIALLPVLVAMTVIAALGVGVALSSLTVRYRDFRYVVPFLVQVWFFVTPVAYPIHHTWLLRLNPMGGTIAAFRASVMGQPIDYVALGCSSTVAVVLLLIGLSYFTHAERQFADLV